MEENKNEELLRLVSEKKFRHLKTELCDMNEVDVAEFIEEVQTDKKIIVFRMLPKELASDVFACLDVDTQKIIIDGITDKELAYIIEELYVDDAVDMLEEMPATVVKRVLQNASPSTRLQINEFLNYPENSAGSIMTAEFIGLRKTMTVEEAFAYIRKHGIDKETIYTCYVMDSKRHLEGVVTVKDLLMNPYDAKIEDIMDTNVIKAVTTEDKEEIADLFNKYDLLSLPVVDHENRLVGIVTIDDAVDVMEEEATEDIEKMAAILPTDKPYFKMTTFETYKKRMPWLLLLMISATFTGAIITSYEEALASYVILTAYIPMLMDTGGNAGSQASVSVIRGLSIGEIEFKEIFKVIWKELRVAVLCGITLASANFVKLLLVDKLALPVAFVICVTLVVVVVFAKFIGCVLPLIAERIGFDPAVMASPLITTIVDAVSLTVYFTIAVAVLHISV